MRNGGPSAETALAHPTSDPNGSDNQADRMSLMLLCPQVSVLASADGTAWSDERIVAAVRGDQAVAAAALAALLRHGVTSRTKNSGAVHSRSLVRLEAARKLRRFRDPACRHVAAISSQRGTRGGAMSGLNLFSKHQQDIPLKSQAFEAAPQESAPAGKLFPAGTRGLSRRGGKRFPPEGATYDDKNQRAVITAIAQCWDGTTCPKTGRVVPRQSCLRFANHKFDLRIVAG
jgi:hypothetical protein